MTGAAAGLADLDRLVAVRLDAASLGGAGPAAARERDVAIRDLIETNRFAPLDRPAAAWTLTVAVRDRRLVLDIAAEAGAPLRLSLPLNRLRRQIADYEAACAGYYGAVRAAPPEAVEAMDHARRAIHDQGAALLRERLAATVAMDAETARRLFTLVAALFWRG